jgi:multiple sugar transport system permease protein
MAMGAGLWVNWERRLRRVPVLGGLIGGKNEIQAVWNRLKIIGKKGFLYFLLIDGAFIFLLPILYMLIISLFTPEDLLDSSIRWIPVHFHWENYLEAFRMTQYQKTVLITLVVTVAAIFGQTIFCSLAGYALARLEFPGKKWVFGAVLFILVIPAQALILPNYIYFSRIKLIRTHWPLILPELFGNGLYGALFVFVFRQVFMGIPKALEDAAAIDGAGIFKTFRLIIAPVVKSAYVTVGLFSFVWHWNEYTRPLYYLDSNSQTLTYALSTLFTFDMRTGRTIASEAVQGAGVILVMLPVILIYIFVQKYFVQGVQMTGIKG